MLEVTYRYHCSHCGRMHTDRPFRHCPGMVMPQPSAPEGWHVFDGAHICPDHQIVVRETVERPL